MVDTIVDGKKRRILSRIAQGPFIPFSSTLPSSSTWPVAYLSLDDQERERETQLRRDLDRYMADLLSSLWLLGSFSSPLTTLVGARWFRHARSCRSSSSPFDVRWENDGRVGGELLFFACVYNATSCLIDPSSGSSWSPRETGRLSSSLARSDDDKSWSITLSLSSPFQFRAPPFPPAIWLIPFFASLIMTASVAAAIV